MKHAPVLLLILALAACGPMTATTTHIDRIGNAIREHEVALVVAVNAEDAAAVAAFYAPDAQMLSPGISHTTPEAIRAAYQGMLDDPNGSLNIRNSDVIVPASGDYAVSQGTYLATYSDPVSHHRASQSGNYINLWRRQEDGSWKIIRDITAPAPTEPPDQ